MLGTVLSACNDSFNPYITPYEVVTVITPFTEEETKVQWNQAFSPIHSNLNPGNLSPTLLILTTMQSWLLRSVIWELLSYIFNSVEFVGVFFKL